MSAVAELLRDGGLASNASVIGFEPKTRKENNPAIALFKAKVECKMTENSIDQSWCPVRGGAVHPPHILFLASQ